MSDCDQREDNRYLDHVYLTKDKLLLDIMFFFRTLVFCDTNNVL